MRSRGRLTPTTPPTGMISAQRLAGRLGMHIIETGLDHVEFADFENNVVITAGPHPHATINGFQKVPITALHAYQGMFYVPPTLENTLRDILHKPVASPRPDPKITPLYDLSDATVMIDPGHGGRDPGTQSARGYHEKQHNLAVARRLGAILTAAGVNVVSTRQNDHFVDLESRVRQANRLNPTLFVSIHADHARNHSVRGFTVYVARAASKRSWAAAHCIRRAMALTDVKSRGIRKANFHVLQDTRCPAVLVETGYLSNPHEAVRLANTDEQNHIAQSIADGIIDFLRQS